MPNINQLTNASGGGGATAPNAYYGVGRDDHFG